MIKQKRTTSFVILLMMLCILYGVQVCYVKLNKQVQIPIIGYHHIVEDKDKEAYFKGNMWVNSLSSFEAQMKLLKQKGYHSVSLDDIYEWRMGRKELDEKSICITFDDGFYSSIKYAEPILAKYGFTGTVFVIGSQIADKRESYLPQKRQHASLKDMEEAKALSFYSHSYDLHHKDGDFRVNQLSREQLAQDTKKAAASIATTYYAYPYGKYNADIQTVLKHQGTKLAFGFNENRKASRKDDPYALPRFNVNAYTKLDVFYQMVAQ